jgi:uncharacterized protein YuzE
LAAESDPGGVEETISLYDDIGVNVDVDRDGRVMGLEVFGYEQSLSRLAKSIGDGRMTPNDPSREKTE